MIRNAKMLRAFEDRLLLEDSSSHEQRVAVFQALLEHAKRLGAMPPANPLEGIEIDIRMAEVINGL